jgi:porin
MSFNDDRIELILPDDDEQGIEVFYTLNVTPWFKLTADFQVIDGALRNADTAWISGLRGRIEF